jgi:hypothetical protein
VVDSGKELFSNSLVSDDYKGVRSLDWVDANRDGKITSIDPVLRTRPAANDGVREAVLSLMQAANQDFWRKFA